LNSLYNNGNWVSTKASLEKGVMGSVAYFVTQKAVERDHLDLRSWHGYQEVVYKDPVDPRYVKFDAFVEGLAEFTFIFNKDSAGFCGFRIHENEKDEYVFFSASPGGRFIKKEKFQVNNLKAHAWNRFEVIFNQREVELKVNNVPVGSFCIDLIKNQVIGFRGSRNAIEIDEKGMRKDVVRVLIDNVVIQGQHGRFCEDFTNRKGFWLILLLISSVLSVFNLLISLLIKKHTFFTLITFNLTILILVSMVYLSLFHFRSLKYETDPRKIDFHGLPNRIDNEMDVIQEIEKNYPGAKEKGRVRVLLIGTSQTRGAGASSDDRTGARVMERILNSGETDKKRYDVINAGCSGSISGNLLGHYRKYWLKLKPDIAVIILATNDYADMDSFRKNLRSFALLNRKNNIKTIFVLEPNSFSWEGLSRVHELIREAASEYKEIMVVDMHGYLLSRTGDGFIWWDFVHLTDFGQELVAEKLAPVIRKKLNER